MDGQLFCIGSPMQLSSKFGGYLMMTITSTEDHAQQVQAFVKQLAPSAQLKYHLGGTQKFILDVNDVKLSQVKLISIFLPLVSYIFFYNIDIDQ